MDTVLFRPLHGFALLAFGLLPLAPARAQSVVLMMKGRSVYSLIYAQGGVETGAKVGTSVIIKSPAREGDIGMQNQLIASLDPRIEAVAIMPANEQIQADALSALTAKIPKLVVVDSPQPCKNARVHVRSDHAKAGETAAEIIAALIADGDEVSFLNHSQQNDMTLAREAAAKSRLRQLRAKSAIRADIYASAEPGSESEKAALLLARYPNTKAVFASDTDATLAMLKVLREQKLAGSVKLVGFGHSLNPEVTAAIKAGELHGWIAWQPYELGRQAVLAATALIKGEQVSPVVNVDYAVVTPANVNDPKWQILNPPLAQN